ncbi:Lrp/AsnC family transcriptional regulator [Myxococcus sp. MISCRS1]|uniref:AsnC family transcriptional regulator n=1 Tax=Myxococcus fulvus TaxID=33 RepID=A0A511T179_MYXFU|nr:MULTISPECIES: Lrp/AsnC family transcriptional regulator [Myxococcus]AKF79121.1 ArsR family transcriptional regulator [Myxococcus fulvus 124B02]BDT30577.1 Lrp/AsnC family transcriptional regulator [Myxococcus sp. MH1]MBZ4395225.1 Lrp/AsnC family transcriptional regulator [Myxococcus sp. AS-1-15]MBZ4414508.1 Lrp/AsnC family transcriptional regulator [Myxococcus sp. XM-1-1-1]MCK8501492.1 Lrp/AsnC family transcriptional regulator [Myxococcus fulvus]
MPMDELDFRLVDLLQRDGRATQLELSRAVGLSQPAVAERIRKLEERGVITGYAARVDATKLGKDITAFIGVSIEHPKYFEGFAKKVLALPDVLECHRVAGQDSYLLKVKSANTRTLDSLLVETLRTIAGVTRTQTVIVLSSIKEDTHVRVPPELAKGE